MSSVNNGTGTGLRFNTRASNRVSNNTGTVQNNSIAETSTSNNINIQNVFEPDRNYMEFAGNIKTDDTRKKLKRLFAKRGQTDDLNVILEILLNGTTNSNAYPLPFQGFVDDRYNVTKRVGSYNIDQNQICIDVNRSFSNDFGIYMDGYGSAKTISKCQTKYQTLQEQRTIHSQTIVRLMNRLESDLHHTLQNSQYEYFQGHARPMGLFILSTKNDKSAQQLFLQANYDILKFYSSQEMFDNIAVIADPILNIICNKLKISFNELFSGRDLQRHLQTLCVDPTHNYILSQIISDLLLRTHPFFSFYITVSLIQIYGDASINTALMQHLVKDQYKYCGNPDYKLNLSKTIHKQREELRLFEKDSPFRRMLETALLMYAKFPPEELLKLYGSDAELLKQWPELLCDTVGGSHVSYNPSEETIRIYTNMDLDHYDRNFLYIQLKTPDGVPSVRPFKGDLKTLAGHFQRNEVIDLHPQIAFLMYYNHSASNNLREILYSSFKGKYGPELFVDWLKSECAYRVVDQYRMGYFILCHAIRNGLYPTGPVPEKYVTKPIPDFYKMNNNEKLEIFKSYLSEHTTFFEIEHNTVLIQWARDQPRRSTFSKVAQCITGVSPLQTNAQFLALFKEFKSPTGGARRSRRQQRARTYRKRHNRKTCRHRTTRGY